MTRDTSPFGSRLPARVLVPTGTGALVLGLAVGWVAHSAGAVQAAMPAPSAKAIPIATQGSYAAVVERVTPAVVTIRTEGRADAAQASGQFPDFFGDFFGRDSEGPSPRRMPRQAGLGSGVVVTPDGYILTNHHVVDQADRITVELADRRTLIAKVVGDVVLAVGNPLGVGQTVTAGIISAKGRTTGGSDGSFQDFIQTDAPINQGNSGGALVNLQGELVGINSQIVSTSGGNIGLGFAIPSNMAHAVMDQLRTNGHVRRARLGVTVEPVTADIAAGPATGQFGMSVAPVTPELAEQRQLPRSARGLVVTDLYPDGHAAAGGIQPNDVIEKVNGQPTKSAAELRAALQHDHGKPNLVLVNRNGIIVFFTHCARPRADTRLRA